MCSSTAHSRQDRLMISHNKTSQAKPSQAKPSQAKTRQDKTRQDNNKRSETVQAVRRFECNTVDLGEIHGDLPRQARDIYTRKTPRKTEGGGGGVVAPSIGPMHGTASGRTASGPRNICIPSHVSSQPAETNDGRAYVPFRF
jgi:hypothetical protein